MNLKNASITRALPTSAYGTFFCELRQRARNRRSLKLVFRQFRVTNRNNTNPVCIRECMEKFNHIEQVYGSILFSQ